MCDDRAVSVDTAAKAATIEERLERVPKDARLVIERGVEAPTTDLIPVGRICDDAADELYRTRLVLKGCMGHHYAETPLRKVAADVSAEFHRGRIREQQQRERIQVLGRRVTQLAAIIMEIRSQYPDEEFMQRSEAQGARYGGGPGCLSFEQLRRIDKAIAEVE